MKSVVFSRGSLTVVAGLLGMLLTGCAGNAALQDVGDPNEFREANTLVPEGAVRYAPTIFPDRIVLLPTQDPATSQTVAWRTDTSLTAPQAQIAVAKSTPDLHRDARRVDGTSTQLRTENGTALHHHVTFTDLEPDTLYAYRVRGGEHEGQSTWSEWFQFRTPKAEFSPFTAVYFGDAQNAVKSHFSRVIREAFRNAPEAMVMVHAGDLVNSRYGVHDDEWGEWFDAGGWMHGMVNQFVSPGNHEFITDMLGRRNLMPQWPAHFPGAGNGPAELPHTVYYTDFQGVRFISLDSTEALQSDRLARVQAEWLRGVLRDNPNQWTIVTHHHPMFSVSLGRDNAALREHWQPVYDEFGVDLVLQGHDHTYGRGQNVTEGTSGRLTLDGPVYMVSVAGPKMYLVSETAEETMDPTAEELQLFQTIQFEEGHLIYEARTVTGALFDKFELTRDAGGRVHLNDLAPGEESPYFRHRCTNPEAPQNRCWNGTELIHAH